MRLAKSPVPTGTVVDDHQFRMAVRSWIGENLPEAWRHSSFGPSDEAHVQRRTHFGRLLGEAGWLSICWARSVGGGEMDASRRIILLEELVAAGAPEPMNANVLGIFAPTLIKFGTLDQCQRFLPGMVNHESIWCQGFSEPGAGSDLAGITTRATVAGDELVVTGQKVWTSYAHLAEYCYALVRTSSESRRHSGLTLVIVPMGQDGVQVRPLRNMVGTEEFCEVFFEDVRVPVANVVGTLGDGWRLAMYALAQERSVGLAQRSLKLAAEFRRVAAMAAHGRTDGNPRVSDALFSQGVVDAYVRSKVVTATVRRAIELDAAGADIGVLSSIAKVFWSESHQSQMDLAAELLGPKFVTGDDTGADWYRAAMFTRAETIYGGTSQIQRNVIARSLGLPK
ncbi:hypothetical protein AFA91_09720 [Mycolicibacterium goodii]|uniref:Acyl-CoA dehydrogenase n=2 Tax=Mycolicibacterium goodii TaxID=134601 RepID=A0A0K0X425_MYCGD|nr:hypothetical protein AFA91_09720 [Mycolicibacterium goodii]